MVGLNRARILSLVRAPHFARIAVILVALLLVTSSVFYVNAKTIYVDIDGKTVKIHTLQNTLGAALAHSSLKIYPEDEVTPSRDMAISEGLEANVVRSTPVILTVDGQIISGRSTKLTVGEALKDFSDQYGLGLKDSDEVSVDRNAALSDCPKIALQRSVPITVKADGKEFTAELAPRPVTEALAKLGIQLETMDKVSLPLDHVIEPQDRIQVVRVIERVDDVQSEIPYQVVAQVGNFPVGLPDRVVSRGSNGLQQQTVKLILEDGKEVDRQVLSQKIIQEPVNQVVSRGAQTSISRGGKEIKFTRAYQMRATAYSAPGGTTATGAQARRGIIAVDPSVISLYSKVYVEGYGEAAALDTGGAIHGNRIDLYMESEAEARAWGVRTVIVYTQ